MQIDFQKCREKNAGSLNELCNSWCKREHVECDALKDWKLNFFKIIDRRISFYSQNTSMLPRKPKISYRYLKSDIEELIGSTSFTAGKLSQVPPAEVLVIGCDRRPELPVMVKI